MNERAIRNGLGVLLIFVGVYLFVSMLNGSLQKSFTNSPARTAEFLRDSKSQSNSYRYSNAYSNSYSNANPAYDPSYGQSPAAGMQSLPPIAPHLDNGTAPRFDNRQASFQAPVQNNYPSTASAAIANQTEAAPQADASCLESGWKKNPMYQKAANERRTQAATPSPGAQDWNQGSHFQVVPTARANSETSRFVQNNARTGSGSGWEQVPHPANTVNHRGQRAPIVDRNVAPVSYEANIDPRNRNFNQQIAAQPQPLSALVSPADVEVSAAKRVQYGKSLARRGAFFAAREEFLNALYLVAESHDRRSGRSNYSSRLKAGLLALDEVKSFGKITRNQDTPQARQFVLGTLQTKIVAPQDGARYTRNQLIELFCQHASSEIVQSLGKSPAASESLFSYGKLLAAETKLEDAQEAINAQSSWAFFLAAATVNPQNHESTNELGARLLKSGQLAKAKEMFLQSVHGANSAVYWSNLAETHRQIAGVSQNPQERNSELSLAQQAAARAAAASQPTNQQAAKYWANTQQFQQGAAMPESNLGVAPTNNSPHPSAAAGDSGENGDGRFITKLKKWF